MKILLFGEFSGFFTCLKDGLTALGHEVFLASSGDGFKNYPSDFRWDSHFLLSWGQVPQFIISQTYLSINTCFLDMMWYF